MRTQFILTGIIFILMIAIIALGIVLLQPPERKPVIDFDYVMSFTKAKRDSFKSVNITYGVNLSLVDRNISGSMIFFKNFTNEFVELSPELKSFTGYAILLPPDKLVRFINVSERREYSGFLKSNDSYCWSTITEPLGEQYNRFLNGDLLFVTCFSNITGYPILVYAGELKDDNVVYSNIFIKNISYTI